MKKALLLGLLAILVVACAPVETAELSPRIVTDTQAPAESDEPQMVGDIVGDLETEPSAPQPSSETPSPSITRAQLAEHNTARDCWVGYNGVVYDLTNWLTRHPGGSGAIAQYCGTVEEFTQAYTNQHNRPDSTRISNRGEEQGALAQ